MKAHAKTPVQAKNRSVDKTAMTTAPVTAAAPALDGRVPRRQLEKSLSLTATERLRCRWYRLRLAIAEMNYATRRVTELRVRLP